jgi:pimeloyl-ACP methyl ester carboxylesterase
VVLTDPRGAGCNDDPRLADDKDLSSEWLARDLLAIVADLERARGNRRLDYVLYGQSYGTVEATIAASLARRLGATPPRAVVLEGTLGHAYANYQEYFATFTAEWQRVRDDLPSRWRTFFREGQFDRIPGSTSKAWALLINTDLMRGYHPDGEHELEWQLSAYGQPTLLASLRMFGSVEHQEVLAGANRLLRVIGCRELYGDLYPLRDLDHGELVTRGADLCRDGPALTHPYDAAAWPVSVPLIYIQGEHDPATSLAQARYHFEREAASPRYFVSIDLAGHAALSVTLNKGTCPAELWHAIGAGMEGFAAAIAHCDSLVGKAHVALEYVPGSLASAVTH